MRKFLLVLITLSLSVILIAGSHPTSAQGPTATPSKDCKPADVIAKAAALTSAKDTAKDLAALQALAAQIRDVSAACAGLKFTGKSAKAIGPFEIPEGTYRVTATTTGFLAAKLDVVSGECGGDSLYIFNVGDGKATDGAETIVKSSGCKTLMTTSNVSAAWTITFELIK